MLTTPHQRASAKLLKCGFVSFSTKYMINDEKTSPRKPMYIVVMSS